MYFSFQKISYLWFFSCITLHVLIDEIASFENLWQRDLSWQPCLLSLFTEVVYSACLLSLFTQLVYSACLFDYLIHYSVHKRNYRLSQCGSKTGLVICFRVVYMRFAALKLFLIMRTLYKLVNDKMVIFT